MCFHQSDDENCHFCAPRSSWLIVESTLTLHRDTSHNALCLLLVREDLCEHKMSTAWSNLTWNHYIQMAGNIRLDYGFKCTFRVPFVYYMGDKVQWSSLKQALMCLHKPPLVATHSDGSLSLVKSYSECERDADWETLAMKTAGSEDPGERSFIQTSSALLEGTILVFAEISLR